MTPSQLENWNKLHPVGSRCTLLKDDGTEIETRTRSEAWLLGGGQVVILIEKYTGSYSLDRLTMHGAVADAPINDGGSAYPQHGWSSNPEVLERMKNQGGMSLRDWFAGQALVGMCACSEVRLKTAEDYAFTAYKIADAMLKARGVE